MLITLLSAGLLMGAYFLLLYAGVGLIQDKRFFSSAPRENLDAIPDRKPQRFPGAHALGWALGVLALLLFAGAFVLGGMGRRAPGLWLRGAVWAVPLHALCHGDL